MMSIEQYRPPEGVDFYEWLHATKNDDDMASALCANNELDQVCESDNHVRLNQLYALEMARLATDPLYELI